MNTFTPETINLLGAALMVALIAGVWIDAYREALGFWWKTWRARLPFGFVRRVGRNPDQAVPADPRVNSGASIGEMRLAIEFAPWIPALPRQRFDNLLAFLRKAEDHLVPHGPPLLLTVCLIFGFVEACMLPMVLGPYLVTDATARVLHTMAVVGGYIVAAVCFSAARYAGILAHRATAIAPHLYAWCRAGRPNPEGPAAILPGADQSMDDGAPLHEQFRARVGRLSASRTIPLAIMAALLVAGVAVMTIRLVDLQRADHLEQTVLTQSEDIDHLLALIGSTLATIVLLILYLAVQLMGFVKGYRHAYNSEASKGVWLALHHQMTFEGYQQVRLARMGVVSNLLATLRDHQALHGRPFIQLAELLRLTEGDSVRPSASLVPMSRA
jgi:hypothetical protein